MTLIQRLEDITWPDREVDAEIWANINNGYVEPAQRPCKYATVWHKDEGIKTALISGYKWRDRKLLGYAHDAPSYTASIDAAITLVPDGWSFGLWGKREVIDCELFLRKTNTVVSVHDAVSEPISICIAALKARNDTATKETDSEVP